MNIVLSIGGSVLLPDLDAGRVERYASTIRSLLNDEYDISVVTGGGFVAREYINVARQFDANEIELDDIGIAVTRLNARLLIAAIGSNAVLTPPTTYEEAKRALQAGKTPVMGGVAQAQTTDAVSAALAEYVNADLLVYATSVPGVYSADPVVDESATRYETISAGQLVETIVDLEMNAGSSAPVDILAAKIIQRAELESIVLDGSDPEEISRAIRTGEFDGTRILRDEAGKLQQDLTEFDE